MNRKAARKIFMLLWLWAICLPLFAYKDVAALVQLKAKEQHDTTGFNLVTETAKLVYDLINEGHITLYSGPDRKSSISPLDLRNLEARAGISFTRSQELFIYESWSSSKKSTSFNMVGISLVGQATEKVMFGFVAADDLIPYLKSNEIGINLNGSPETTFWQAYRSRRYLWYLVQFGGDDFKDNPRRALEIREQSFNEGQKIEDLARIPHIKGLTFRVAYRKYTTDLDESGRMFQSLATFFKTSPEFLLNHSNIADSARRKLQRGVNFDFQRLESHERWQVNGRDTIRSIQQITVYDRQYGIISFTTDDLRRYRVYAGFESLEEFIIRRSYPYRLVSLNDIPVKIRDQDNIMEALNRYFWPQLTVYAQAK